MGLPPTPIANPGEEAMRAAINPTPGDWLYFVTVKPGDTRFTADYAEHQRNVAEFNRNQRTRTVGSASRARARGRRVVSPPSDLTGHGDRAGRQAAAGSSASSRLMSRTAARPARLAPIVLADGPVADEMDARIGDRARALDADAAARLAQPAAAPDGRSRRRKPVAQRITSASTAPAVVPARRPSGVIRSNMGSRSRTPVGERLRGSRR